MNHLPDNAGTRLAIKFAINIYIYLSSQKKGLKPRTITPFEKKEKLKGTQVTIAKI